MLKGSIQVTKATNGFPGALRAKQSVEQHRNENQHTTAAFTMMQSPEAATGGFPRLQKERNEACSLFRTRVRFIRT